VLTLIGVYPAGGPGVLHAFPSRRSADLVRSGDAADGDGLLADGGGGAGLVGDEVVAHVVTGVAGDQIDGFIGTGVLVAKAAAGTDLNRIAVNPAGGPGGIHAGLRGGIVHLVRSGDAADGDGLL